MSIDEKKQALITVANIKLTEELLGEELNIEDIDELSDIEIEKFHKRLNLKTEKCLSNTKLLLKIVFKLAVYYYLFS